MKGTFMKTIFTLQAVLGSFFIVGLFLLMLLFHAKWTASKNPPQKNGVITTKASPISARLSPAETRHDYSITYGDKTAPHELVSFFDIGCTHCATFFKEKFSIINKTWVENGQLRLVFKPYPIHQETVVFMSCCEELTAFQKLILFETLMETENPSMEALHTAMKVLKRPFKMPTSSALKEALLLTSKHQFEALPMMFFDGWPLSDDDQDDLVHFLRKV